MSAPITSPETGHAALTGALNSSFRVLRWLMMLVAGFYVFSGVFIVGQHERAYVLVFGKIDGLAGERLKGPGLHFTWPRPIAEVIKIPTERVQTVDSATFWYREERTPDGQSTAPGTLRPGTDGYTLTGDANLIHSKWAIRYTVIDPDCQIPHRRAGVCFAARAGSCGPTMHGPPRSRPSLAHGDRIIARRGRRRTPPARRSSRTRHSH